MSRENTSLEKKLQRRRHSNSQGAIIPLHHSFKQLRFGASAKISMILLPLLFDFLLWESVDSIIAFWARVFRFWTDTLGLQGQISFMQTSLLGHAVLMPFPDLSAALPSHAAVWGNLVVVIVLFALTLAMPAVLMPLTYLLRASLLIQGSASLFFLISQQPFPYDLPHYIVGQLLVGLYMMLLLPILLAMIYYIFDFPVWRKCTITALMLLYFVIALPMQYMMHAFILHACSLLFLPLLYLLFGLLLDVIMFIAFYAFGMTWHSKPKDDLGRFA